MNRTKIETGVAPVNNANIYYETAGQGRTFVMIHAGVADHRQWNNEFSFFAARYQVIRYDLRGYGKSAPVEGTYSNLQDLTALLDHLKVEQPLILMGCSMGGSLAMDFALAYPHRANALILAGSGPSGLELDVPELDELEQAEAAFKAGDLERAAELETQVWFDGMGRTPGQVNQDMRQLAYEMNLTALSNAVRKLGQRVPNSQVPAVDHLDELKLPVLVIVGENDLLYMHAAADYLLEKIPSARKVLIADAAHLTNLDQPDVFQQAVRDFLANIS